MAVCSSTSRFAAARTCWASATTSEWDRCVTFLALVSSRPALHSELLLVATCYPCRENDSDCNQVSTIRIWLLLHRSFSFAAQDIRSHHRKSVFRGCPRGMRRSKMYRYSITSSVANSSAGLAPAELSMNRCCLHAAVPVDRFGASSWLGDAPLRTERATPAGCLPADKVFGVPAQCVPG
jgi:hypothetical protein